MTPDPTCRADLYKAALEAVREWLTDYEVMIGKTPALELHVIVSDALAEDDQTFIEIPNGITTPVSL